MLSNLITTILDWLSGRMPTPVPYQSFAQSWFHYLALAIIALGAYLALRYLKTGDPRRTRIFVLGIAILLLTFEVYKQLIMNHVASGGFLWYIFPFQFCSTPMYIALIAGLSKPGRFQTILYEFLATYGLFAGLAVLAYPNSVFIDLIGINVQTMVHHGAMAIMGLALLIRVIKPEHKVIFRAATVFTTLLIMAMLMNWAYNTWIHNGVFNMFFINDHYGNHLPILSIIYAATPYPVFLLAYVLGFAAAAYVMLLLGIVIRTPHPTKVRIRHGHA